MNTQKMVLVPLEKYERMKSSKAKISEPAGVQITVEEVDQDPQQSTLDKETILQAIPKMYKTKCHALLNFIEKGNVLSWNDKGELVYNTQSIPNSHIADLLKNAMREYNNFDPIGKEEFYRGLAQTNVPLLLIDNKDNRDLLVQGKSKTKRETCHRQPPQWIHI